MVNWTDHAKAQLRQIHDHIAQDSPIYARRVSEALVHKSMMLEQYPKIGRKVPELNEDAVREVSMHSYRILYEIGNTHIDILALIHKRQELQPDQVPRD